jgi:ubiquinone biosynthesis protein
LPSQQEGSIDPRHLERLVARLERGQYRQVQALLVSAGFIGGSLMLAGRVPPAPWEISLFGLIIFLGSAGWASWLMFVSRRFLREWE